MDRGGAGAGRGVPRRGSDRGEAQGSGRGEPGSPPAPAELPGWAGALGPGALVSSAVTQPGGQEGPCTPRSPRRVPGPCSKLAVEHLQPPGEVSGSLFLGGCSGTEEQKVSQSLPWAAPPR